MQILYLKEERDLRLKITKKQNLYLYNMKDIEKELKLVEFRIDDEEGDVFGDLSLISIVSSPAIESNFHLFSKEKKHSFVKIDKERQVLVGPAMIPNKAILRFNEETQEYFNCYFTEETVRKCSEIFLKNSNHTKTSLEHSEVLSSNQMKDCYVTQSWIVKNSETDTANSYGFSNMPVGTWMCEMKIESPKLWAIIKENNFNGFSIEGNFAEKFASLFSSEQELENKIYSIILDDSIPDLEKEIQIRKLIS